MADTTTIKDQNSLISGDFTESAEPFRLFSEWLSDAVEAEPMRLGVELARVERDRRYNSLQLGTWSYLLRSQYDEHVARWFEYFPREQFLFIKAEDMFRDAYATLDTVTDFLDISRFRPPELPRLKDGGAYEPLSAETRTRLAEYFQPHNERLQELTGIDFRWTA